MRRKLTEAELRAELIKARQEISRLRRRLALLENPPRPTVICVDDVDLAFKAANRGAPRKRFIVGRDPRLED
jgi:hypothetical protein